MSAFSAADLQKRHELEGAPDPFPSLVERGPAAPRPTRNPASAPLDTGSEVAFPSLAPTVAPAIKQTTSAWGASSGPRIAPAVVGSNLVTDNFTLTSIDLSTAGRDGKPTTLGEIMKQVMAKHKVKIEASSNQTKKQTTFNLKSESTKELEKAKRTLIAQLSPTVTITVNAPASTIATIVGPKGANLKQIRDATNVKIDIPRKDTQGVPQVNGNGTAHPDVHEDEEDEPMVPITVTGPQPLAYEAQMMLNAIIKTKTAKSTQRVRDIPSHILPFVTARRAEFLAAKGDGEVTLALNGNDREIAISGDRDSVGLVADKIKATIEFFKTDLTSFVMSLPKRQHRLLIGKAVDEIMAKSKCGVVVPRPEDPSDQITVWGNGNDLPAGMAAIMSKANSQYIHEFPLPGPVSLSKQIITYMARTSYPKTLSSAHDVSVYTPTPGVLSTGQVLNIDLIGEKPAVDAAVEQLSGFVAGLMGGTKEVDIDWLVHRVLTGKNAKKIKQFHEAHNVLLFFPPESAEQSSVLLVYDPLSTTASRNPAEKAKHLGEVEKELLKLAGDAADVKSQVVSFDKKWHPAVLGKDGTTLNAIIGEDKTLSIKFGLDSGESSEDAILVRGASSDVDRAVAEIRQIVENAKNDEIDNSYSTEFDISRDYVGRIVGSQGAAINKLRDSLGVKIDFFDEAEEKEKEGKKKKSAPQKSHVKITGRKENVEEAKKRILAQVDRLADETQEILKIPAQYHASLIGQNGKYVIRLEEKYAVKITFARDHSESEAGKSREGLKTDEVLIKGGKKGVAGAKSELIEALEFEKESNNQLKFTVPTRSVARILGKGGASITEIKESTGAQIDVDKGNDEMTTITCRGTKKAINEAKEAITAIADSVHEEIHVALTVEQKFHRTIIGPGGQGLRDLVARVGGPADTKQQAGLIRFPRQGETSDEVRLRGEPALVKKLQKELEKVTADLRDRVVLYVEIPHAQHRALIGRGGQHLNDLQSRTGAQVQFPGSRSYGQVGEGENAADFSDADPQDVVKVSGPRKGCEEAIKALQASVKPPKPSAPAQEPTPSGLTEIVSVPVKYLHFISQQGGFFRTLRSFGVNVDQSKAPPKFTAPSPPPVTASARIDDDPEEAKPQTWQVVQNYQDAEEGNVDWTLKARDEEGLERAKKAIADAIVDAEKCTSVGFLTLPDRSAFPRIVGTKGANVARLRAETGAEITVSRENNTIVIIGSQGDIEAARDAILRIAAGRRRND